MELDTSGSIDPTVNAATDSTADSTIEPNDDQADSTPPFRTKVRTPKRPKRSNASKIFSDALDSQNIANVGLADHLGVSRSLISAWRIGAQKIPIARAKTIAQYIGIDPDYFRNILVSEYYPELFDEEDRKRTAKRFQSITPNEWEFLKIIRDSEKDPKMNKTQKDMFRLFVASLSGGK